MKPIKLAFFDTKPYDKEVFDTVNQQFGFEIKYFKFHLTADNVLLTQGFEGIVIFVNDIVDEYMVDQLYNNGVRLIALRCAGFNNVDLKAAKGKITVVRVPAYSPHAVAEHTVALMLTLNRKIHRAYFRTRDANFALNGLLGFDMQHKTVGIIGTGKIGKVLAKILIGFEMQVLVYDKYPDYAWAQQLGCRYVELDELFRKSDIISLNCPLTKETEYIINREAIHKMKDGVMIINTGRGKLINTKHLIEGLKSGKIGSAGLDVYEEESKYFFEDMSDRVLTDDILARLLTFNNVIITSHQGFFTQEAIHNIALVTLENIRSYIEGKPLVNEVKWEEANL
ncbi:MAG: 2-hydroxyacid dehydrogenase [Bacteroidales bacterium]|nr:2-hydroxyacid dehydrogenase [Bacteroidales bacterium]HPO65661.1 2-hydroxyacid dehydrogenase [Bacteroidales bacterium]